MVDHHEARAVNPPKPRERRPHIRERCARLLEDFEAPAFSEVERFERAAIVGKQWSLVRASEKRPARDS